MIGLYTGQRRGPLSLLAMAMESLCKCLPPSMSHCLFTWACCVCGRSYGAYHHLSISPPSFPVVDSCEMLCLIKLCYQVSWQGWAQRGAWCVAPHPAAAMPGGDAPLSSMGFV